MSIYSVYRLLFLCLQMHIEYNLFNRFSLFCLILFNISAETCLCDKTPKTVVHRGYKYFGMLIYEIRSSHDIFILTIKDLT